MIDLSAENSVLSTNDIIDTYATVTWNGGGSFFSETPDSPLVALFKLGPMLQSGSPKRTVWELNNFYDHHTSPRPFTGYGEGESGNDENVDNNSLNSQPKAIPEIDQHFSPGSPYFAMAGILHECFNWVHGAKADLEIT